MDLYTLTLALDATAGATLRNWLTDILNEHVASPDGSRESAEIVLATAEALNTAVRNAAPRGTSVVVTMTIVGRNVYVTVTDRDKGPTAVFLPDDGGETEPAVATQLGLTLMHGLVDQVDLYDADDGKVVRLVKRLHLPARQPGVNSSRPRAALADGSHAV